MKKKRERAERREGEGEQPVNGERHERVTSTETQNGPSLRTSRRLTHCCKIAQLVASATAKLGSEREQVGWRAPSTLRLLEMGTKTFELSYGRSTRDEGENAITVGWKTTAQSRPEWKALEQSFLRLLKISSFRSAGFVCAVGTAMLSPLSVFILDPLVETLDPGDKFFQTLPFRLSPHASHGLESQLLTEISLVFFGASLP